jgi:CubicO group peptidase (beta-lactamase class C family)
MCHDVLAALVEKVSGQRFSDYVRDHIFVPLGMHRSSFRHDISHPELLAEQYEYRQGVRVNCGKFLQLCNFGPEYESGGAGCVSCTDDYIRFTEALRLGHRILKPETVDLLASDQTTNLDRHVYDDWGMTHYGYGMGVRCPREGYSTTDFGWDGVAGSLMAVDKKNEISIFYAQHVLGSPVHNDRLAMLPIIQEACAKL